MPITVPFASIIRHEVGFVHKVVDIFISALSGL